MAQRQTRDTDARNVDMLADLDSAGMRTLIRLSVWGGGAAAALLLVAIASTTEIGNRRIAGAYAAATGSAQQTAAEQQRRLATRERDLEIESRRLADSLRNLAEDRDRLLVRMTALERNYEDVTGSITRMSATPPTAQRGDAALPPTDLAPVASIPAIAPDRAGTAAAIPETTDSIAAKSEFGVDLGGGPSLAALRNAWNQVRKTHGAQLEGLKPVVGVRESKAGQVDLRLVVGPIGNAAAAAKLCASLAAGGLSCQPTMYDGQRLALR